MCPMRLPGAPRMKMKPNQSGLSLIETLVALVVFAVGVLGVASLMLTSMRHSDATLARSQSTMLANEIYEMMQANQVAAEAGDYSLAMNASLLSTSQTDCGTNICSATQIATWDLDKWGARVNRVMRGADAAVSVDTTVDPMLIQVQLSFDASQAITESFTFRLR